MKYIVPLTLLLLSGCGFAGIPSIGDTLHPQHWEGPVGNRNPAGLQEAIDQCNRFADAGGQEEWEGRLDWIENCTAEKGYFFKDGK